MTSDHFIAIEDALRSISFAWKDGDRNLVALPVQYPSGALCTLDVHAGRLEAHVSDMARGFREASTLCDETCFARLANAEARRRGIVYEDGAFVVRKVDIGMLAAALVAVGNASVFVARDAIRMDAEKKEEAHKEAIYHKVRLAFLTRMFIAR